MNDYPSNAALMRHLLLHAAGSMAFQNLRILQLHDISLLSRRMSEADWRAVIESHAPGRCWWAYPPLELTARYYPNIPESLLAEARRGCPHILRRSAERRTLTDASYSYLWVKAFPGIEWSQSVLEILQYGISRVRPSRTHIAARRQVAAAQTWAKYGEWSNMSQARRMFRWLTSRQARPATMHTIAAAFSEP
jgi:hypothetical protein